MEKTLRQFKQERDACMRREYIELKEHYGDSSKAVHDLSVRHQMSVPNTYKILQIRRNGL